MFRDLEKRVRESLAIPVVNLMECVTRVEFHFDRSHAGDAFWPKESAVTSTLESN
jgi:hypothetical protein